MRCTTEHLFRTGRLLLWGVPATGVLVETLLDRCADGDSESDLAEAEVAIERLAEARADEGFGGTRDLAAAAAGSAGAGPRRRCPLSRIPGSLPGYGEPAWLRGAYRVGRGNAVTPAQQRNHTAILDSTFRSVVTLGARGHSADDLGRLRRISVLVESGVNLAGRPVPTCVPPTVACVTRQKHWKTSQNQD